MRIGDGHIVGLGPLQQFRARVCPTSLVIGHIPYGVYPQGLVSAAPQDQNAL